LFACASSTLNSSARSPNSWRGCVNCSAAVIVNRSGKSRIPTWQDQGSSIFFESNIKQLTNSQYTIANSPSTPDLCGIKQMVAKLHRIAPFDKKLSRHFHCKACTTGLFQADLSQGKGIIYLLHLLLARGRGSLVKRNAVVDCSRVMRTTFRDRP
jgi:hypothetical protein